MKLSEELTWRGFVAEHTFKDIKDLDERTHKFYFGVDPSADSMTIGNLAALMMCHCFIVHGYTPYLLVGGATGQIGDPKDTGERDLKSLSEVENNKQKIAAQFERIVESDFTLVDNNDWFKDMRYLHFLREVGKQFSMTQLLDREFVRARIGEGGSGISYAEFSYSLIQGYDFLHLYRTYGIDLQLCGTDQFGNCTSGLHLIKRLENAEAEVWSTPLIIDKTSNRKFGKSEGNAIWLAESKTSVLDFYQFWLNLPDEQIDYYLKIYTFITPEELDTLMEQHNQNPAARLAQKDLARRVTWIVHGGQKAESVVKITTVLFGDQPISELSDQDLSLLAEFIPALAKGTTTVSALVSTNLATSKSEARTLISSGAISVNGTKITSDEPLTDRAIIKKGKNKFILIS